LNKIFSLRLKKKLDYHYYYFDRNKISPDPLEFLHRYCNYHDIEISGLLSSLFAFGSIKQIMNSIEKLHSIMLRSPYSFVINYDINEGIRLFSLLKHRFYSGTDISKLFYALNKIYKKFDSLETFFLMNQSGAEIDIKERISTFSKNMIELMAENDSVSYGNKFMFPDPVKGSACKRMNLFLRWMVRKDELDFGLWKKIQPSKLIIPVDTHVAIISKELKLTSRKNVSWKMAEEITNNLRELDPADPVKYDFAICHIGMRKMKF
jgi:uncharacterized protein (TIGR02757 family)